MVHFQYILMVLKRKTQVCTLFGRKKYNLIYLHSRIWQTFLFKSTDQQLYIFDSLEFEHTTFGVLMQRPSN